MNPVETPICERCRRPASRVVVDKYEQSGERVVMTLTVSCHGETRTDTAVIERGGHEPDYDYDALEAWR